MALTPPPARRITPQRSLSSSVPPATSAKNAQADVTIDGNQHDGIAPSPSSAPAAPEAATETTKSLLPPRGAVPARGASAVTRPALPPRGAAPPAHRPPATQPAATTAPQAEKPPAASPAPTRTTATRSLPPTGRTTTPPATRNIAAPHSPPTTATTSGVTGERRGAFVHPQTASAERALRANVFVTIESGPDVVFGVNGEAPRPEDQESALHPIRSISITTINPDGTKENKTFTGETGERDGMTTLLKILNTEDENALYPRLITYGGRNSLLPRLYVAAMLHGLKLGIVSETPNRHASYQTRFNSYYHLDLADQISHYGASRAPALHALTVATGGQKGLSDMESLIFIYNKMRDIS